MSECVLFIDELTSSCIKSVCRICHEHEFESCKRLEAPCACSGTLKFAHRDCIQRWCNEKGNTSCEICLQKFKPGYTTPPKKPQLIHTTTSTIRGSLVVPTNEPEQENWVEILETDYTGCTSSLQHSSASCCRLVALILTALLLIKHLLADITGGARGYPFSLLTVLIVKSIGIVVPMYILVRIIAVIHNNIKHYQYQVIPAASLSSDNEDIEDDDEQIEGHNNA